jgi:hypothetical protein
MTLRSQRIKENKITGQLSVSASLREVFQKNNFTPRRRAAKYSFNLFLCGLSALARQLNKPIKLI